MITKYVSNLQFMREMVIRFVSRAKNELGDVNVGEMFGTEFRQALQKLEEANTQLIHALNGCEKMLNWELKRRLDLRKETDDLMEEWVETKLIEYKHKLDNGE